MDRISNIFASASLGKGNLSAISSVSMAAMLAMGLKPMPIVQYYSVILSLILATLFIASVMDANSTGSVWGIYPKLIFVDVCILVLVGVFLLPASGRMAAFLMWHAVTATLIVLSVVIAGFITSLKKWNFFWPYAILIIIDFLIVIIIWLNQ